MPCSALKLPPSSTARSRADISQERKDRDTSRLSRRHRVVLDHGGIGPKQLAVTTAKGVDLPVYAIRVVSPVDDPENDLFLGVHGASFRGEDALRRFTEETGGAMYEGSQWGQLVVASARIREELKTQYRIGYIPQQDEGDGEFRRIQVETRRRGIEVRTRKGYYPKKRLGLGKSRPATSGSSN